MKIQQILGALPALRELNDTDMNINAAIKVSRVIKQVEEVTKLFNDKKETLFKLYGEENENNEITIKDEHIEVFNKEMQDILDQDIDMETEYINTDILGDINIKPSTITTLSWMFEE